MKKVIDSFRGRYEFLSNFWREKDGLTVEHRFQALKNHDPRGREPFPRTMSPGEAKAAGRRLKLRADWEKVKDEIMEDLVRKKFSDDKAIARELVETEDAILIEGNTWHDQTWGMVKDSSGKWHGQNRLGKILMKVRDEIRAKSS